MGYYYLQHSPKLLIQQAQKLHLAANRFRDNEGWLTGSPFLWGIVERLAHQR